MATLDTMPTGKYPAKAHAERVAAYIRSKDPNADGIIYLEGQKTRMIEDSDEAQHFRQRRYFFYLSGCNLPDCYLTYSLSTSHLTLYIPPLNPSEVMWLGLPLSPEAALAKYDVDDVVYSTDVSASLVRLGKGSGKMVYAINAQVSDHITFLEFEGEDFSLLKEAIEVTRAVKDEYEIGLIRHANAITAQAHHAVMQAVKHAGNERELEALFIQRCIARGAREQAYHSIVASGTNAATLHYQGNDEPLGGRLNLLLDAGGEVDCYASDVTRTFPISGKFSKESRGIYDIVLEMQKACTEVLYGGVLWDEVHALAHQIAIKGLLKLGILKGGTAEEIFEARTSVAFFPHGLGHYLGLDTHDTGGNPNYEDKDSMFRYLRVRGKLPAGSVVTVEPGIYFCKFIIDPYLEDPAHSRYIDKAVLDKYWDVGGVRIEDNVLVTKDGYVNLTTATKEVAEMEKLINGS